MSQLTLNLIVPDALEAMEFYEKAFDGLRKEVYSFPDKTGLNEANIIVGDVALRLMDENPAFDCYSPKKEEIDSMWLQLVVPDVVATLQKAAALGATITQEPDEFMGTRHAEIVDPSGYTWTINQIIREVSFEERYRFYQEFHERT